MNTTHEARPPFPPFTLETAAQKVRMAEDAWNNRDPKRVVISLYDRQPVAKPCRISRRSGANYRVPYLQMGKRARIPFNKRTMGL